MRIMVNDLGSKNGDDGKLHSIGQTSILLEWMEENNVLYRMLLDMGLKSKEDDTPDEHNLLKIKNIMEDEVSGYDSGIQAMACTHCHEDHIGGYPWFYHHFLKNTNYKNKEGKIIKGFPVSGIPKLFMTSGTQNQFSVSQDDLYGTFSPEKTNMFYWDKTIINEINSFIRPRYWSSESYNITLGGCPKPPGFDIYIRFRSSGHILASSMIEIDTIRNNKSLGKILFTGDVCFREGSFLVNPITPSSIKDTYKAIIMEGTYIWDRPDTIKKEKCNRLLELLRDKINDTLINKGGNVVLLVYAIDRTANILVALRQLVDGNYLGLNMRNKIFLDTRTGRHISRGYEYDLVHDLRFGADKEEEYFKDEIVNRYKTNGKSIFQLDDGNEVMTNVIHPDMRKEIIDNYRNGGCIVIATSATLKGGTALIQDSYMHPNGWGSDKKNLFLVIGSAIPGIKARIALGYYKDFKKCNLDFSYRIGDEGRGTESAEFSSRLEEMPEYSAHANINELRDFVKSTHSNMYIFTHLGGRGGKSIEVSRYQTYINDTFMSGVRPSKKMGAKLIDRGDTYILSENMPASIELEQATYNVEFDKETYNMLNIKCRRDKGDFYDKLACDVIRRLITEDDKRIAELSK